MSYDYHGSWESVTGFSSPLFSNPGDILNTVKISIFKTNKFFKRIFQYFEISELER